MKLGSIFCLMLGLLIQCVCVAQGASAADPWLRPPVVPHPADNEPTQVRVDLGKALFFDPRLSGSGFLSCASCHNPAMGWTDGLATGFGHGFQRLGRATPTVLNAAFQPLLMWDGRKNSLEDQALGPVESPGEMNMPLDELIKRLSSIAGYLPLFEKAYPGQGVSKETVAKALASFERTIVSTTAPFDRWRKGDAKAINESAKRGFALFTGKANCALCHQGFDFSDHGFHNIGVKSLTGTDDEGRFAHRKIKVLKGAFKTPTLRDIELTAPYMHNGMYKTLDEVVEHYDRGGDVKDNLSPNMKPLGLSVQEKHDLVAFMSTLTGDPRQIVLPSLPKN
jgi:cytochrome c peroxidase